MTQPAGPPPLDDVAGEWIDVGRLAHLPSLRNQWGQGHVNHDLTSLSWLAAPPYTFGYHTGVLRLDGAPVAAQRFRWKPWGVRRQLVADGLCVTSDTRLGLRANHVLWRIDVENRSAGARWLTLDQDLFAAVAHTETGWGWLYDVPWSSGNYHDYFTLERVRHATTEPRPAGYLLGAGPRRLRLGRPRPPGIQRDADGEIMSLAYELPRHVSQDTVYPHPSSAEVSLRRLTCRDAAGAVILFADAQIALHRDSEVTLGTYELAAGQTVELQLRPEAAASSGVVLTHGNQPDSLQLGLADGHLWLGLAGEQAVLAPALEPGRWHQVRIAVDHGEAILTVDAATTRLRADWTHAGRWTAAVDGGVVAIADTRSRARAGYAFATAPDQVVARGAGACASWTLRLPPGEGRRVGVVCAYGDDPAGTAATATGLAAGFEDAFGAVRDGYRRMWQDMFVAGNDEFSGHLPVLDAEDAGIGRSYYTAALQALYLRNTNISAEPIFLTGGPRLGPTTTYYWDHTEWSRLYALLEPAGLRSWLLRALAGPYDRAFGFDTRNGGPLGNHYAANDYALYRLVEHYVCVTGDLDFLCQRAGDRPVLTHLRDLALAWQRKQTAGTGGVLADVGPDPWEVLECVPNYVNAVASFNAAYVGMTRSYAALLAFLGRDDEARELRRDAGRLAAAVLEMSEAGGRWQIRHPERAESIGHVLDFGLTASYLHDDLDAGRREAMVEFVRTKLLASTWMRALAPDDPAAPAANRADHGAAGAFGAWPGVTAHGLAKLGRVDLAARLLGVVHASTSGALWGQAMEIVDDPRGQWVRVAEAGISNRDAIAAVATAEAVVSGLFGFEPDFHHVTRPLPTEITVEGLGALRGLNVGRGRALDVGRRRPA